MMLEGKVALVSGLGPGMGRDITLTLAREGADIVMAARREKRMNKVAEEVEALGRKALCVATDVTDASACAALADAVRREYGRLDVLVNNAFSTGPVGPLATADLDTWRDPFEVNVFGTLRLTQAVLPLLTEQDESRIVMINTMSMQEIEAGWAAYAGSKAALATMTKTLARELGRDGVRVNGIHPGYIWGASVEWYINHQAEERGVPFQTVYDEIAGQTSLGYIPDSAEISGAVLFFASALSRGVTGQALAVNGGIYLGGTA
jgi:NAD(P)-dependent dehydrogenase (short-subunit alcohol dehydrogenase family)